MGNFAIRTKCSAPFRERGALGEQVHLEGATQLSARQLLQGRGGTEASVVHEHVDASEDLERTLHQTTGRALVGQIGGNRKCRMALPGEGLAERFQSLRAPSRQHHLEAGPRQAAGRGLSDSR